MRRFVLPLVLGGAALVVALAYAPILVAQEQRPGYRPRRSPRFVERQAATAAAAQALREATGPYWKLIADDEVGTVLWSEFTPGPDAMPRALKATSPRAAVRAFLGAHGMLWGGPSLGASLRELSEKIDRHGGVHLFYQQIYRGVDVEGAELAFHITRDRTGLYVVQAVSGRFHPDIDIDVTPALSGEDAIDVLAAEVGAQYPLEGSRSRLTVLLVENTYRLTWRVRLVASRGAWVGDVDARNGEILRLRPLFRDYRAHADEMRQLRTRASDSRTTALQGEYVSCSGKNVFGNPVSFTCFDTGSGWELRDNSNPSAAEIRVYDETVGLFCVQPSHLSVDTDDGIWDKSWQLDEASAMWNGNAVLDHYRTKYGRHMFTGNSADLLDYRQRDFDIQRRLLLKPIPNAHVL